jgi:hypothetical protein
VSTLQWVRDVMAVLFTGSLALGFAVPFALVLGVVMPGAQQLYTVALAQGFEEVGRQLRRAVEDP